jgi:hypothetical protein
MERMVKEIREKLDADFNELTTSEEYKDWSPYGGIDLTRGDGKIEVETEDYHAPDVKGKTAKKYRYFIVKPNRADDSKHRFFVEFDWKAKGVVRKRFQSVQILPLIRYPYGPNDLKEKLTDLITKCKALEEVVGKVPMLRQVV